MSGAEQSSESAYDRERVENAKTMGDSYSNHALSPQAFVGGAQYALDKLLNALDGYPVHPVLAEAIDNEAARILQRAKAGEPQ